MNVHTFFKRFGRISAALLLVGASVASTLQVPVHAETTDVATAQVSFTFDDGFASSYTQAAPTLAKYGLTGTNYVTTGCVGMTRVPNTCRADNMSKYMTWTQVQELQNKYGWEIGSHTVTHPLLASSDRSAGQSKPLTQEQVIYELKQSKADLAARGINAQAFAFPYGDYNNFTRATAAKYYSSQRGFADTRDNVYPYNDSLLNNMPVQVPVSVATVKAKIDYAIANDQWLVLTFHEIKQVASSDPADYEYSTANLDRIAAYVKAKQDAGQLKNVNVTNGLAKSSGNLLPNGGFADGIAGGWRTDNPAAFAADANLNGSFPNAQRSVKVTSTATHSHLFSPRVNVSSNQNYLIKSYLNVQRVTAGEVGYYIDEYDANGNWVSGQFKTRETSSWVQDMNFVYRPTSIAVKTASLQIYVTANAGLVGYLDNVNWSTVGAPTVVQPTSMMPNGTFDAGIAQGWSTDDPANIVADSLNNGSPSNAANSVAITAQPGTRNTHLLSPQVNVDATKTYYLENYLNITQRTTGDIGFYIDEYDISGNWISGQYKTGVSALGPRDVSFSYTPSSASVAKAQLQVIVVTGDTKAYFDNSRWYLMN